MSNKIVFIHGSSRSNSNTGIIASAAMQAARAEQADVSEIEAIKTGFEIPGCLGCLKCQQSDDFSCAVGDQLATAVATLPRYDVIVLATPLYWMSYPAQVKMLVDRMCSLMRFTESGEIQTPLAGKTFALMATGSGVLENNLHLLEQQWGNVARMLSCSLQSCLFPNAPVEAGAFKHDPAALDKAREFGRRLASSA